MSDGLPYNSIVLNWIILETNAGKNVNEEITSASNTLAHLISLWPH